ncbi:MAG: dipeptide ABC transporter ATP-binding protein [Deltaproteobacteria bacterium]|jgi:oligopeptide transport system ATP-binding protein|nr:dipeptide ABC transporter ATP-binding protein [Deltaproteobacteria bacterium]
MSEVLVEAKNLTKHFPVTKGLIFSKQVGAVKAVDGINFTINRGETFGLVGESGCGKSTTSKLILLLESITNGTIVFEGNDIAKLSKSELREYRGKVQAVFQDPFSSLSPRRRVGKIIAEPIVVNSNIPQSQIRDKTAELLEVVGLRPDQASFYPHEFSGGQRQRIAVARSLALNPSLIILDEPVSALDVSIRAQIMNLLKGIQKKFNLAFLLIAHDLAVVKHMSDRIGVMYLGKLVETASSADIYHNPLHPYTKALYAAALPSHPDQQKEKITVTGEVPSPLNPPEGCRFHPRCPEAFPRCTQEEPKLIDMGNDQQVSCHLYDK